MPPTDSTPPANTPNPRKRRNVLWKAVLLSRAKKRWRWTFRLAVAVPLAFVAAAIVLTHSPLTRMLILPRVAAASGLNADSDSVHISRTGTIVMDQAVFTIPGVVGEAGRFLRIARVEADVDWWRTITGEPTVTAVRMYDPVLVVSESRDDGTLNIGSVPVPTGSGGMELPGISATNVGLELGEHGRDGYKALKRIQMDGSLTPAGDKPGVYTVALYESSRQRGIRTPSTSHGFTLGGTFSDGRIDLKLLNFSLSDWPTPTLPPSIRAISENLALSGEVSSATFAYTREDGIKAGLELKSVAMNLPLEAQVEGPVYQPEGVPPPPRYMRMRDVNGRITFARDSVLAVVGGLIEDLPYQVTLRYHGVEEDSPFELDFETREFHMSRNPELLLFAPPMVKYYLKAFLMPTGIISTHVRVIRGAPVPAEGGMAWGPITVSGSIDFREGTAAYEVFPYEFNDMTGRFEFDNNQVKIVSVTGQSRTGARLHAVGRIAPLDETSEVDIHVAVSDAQIDEAMEAAFGEDRGAVIAALFNEAKHQELVDAGLVRTPEQAAAEEREIESLAAAGPSERLETLRRRSNIPVFPFRGRADVTVRVYAPRGYNVAYQTSVDVFLPKVGLVPEKFSLPVIGENVSVEVRNDRGRIAFGSFRGVSGGRAEVNADFTIPGKSGGASAAPRIEVRIIDMPVDDRLVHALPGPADSRPKRMLRDLRVLGVSNGTVRIAPRNGGDDIGFDADIAIRDGEARPAPYLLGESESAMRIAVSSLSGRLEASERRLTLDLDGVPVQPLASEEPRVGPPLPLAAHPRIGGTMTVHVDGEFPPGDGEPSFYVFAGCPGFDLSSPFESLVAVFSRDAAASVQRTREQYRPSGFVDARVEVVSEAGRPQVEVKLGKARSLAAEFLGSRALVPETEGAVVLRMGEGGRAKAKFEGVSGGLFYAGQRSGFATLNGEVTIGTGGEPGEQLEASLMDVRLESELTRRIIDQLEGEETGSASVYSRFNPAGEFDAAVLLTPDPEGGPFTVKGRITPRSLSLRTGETQVVFSSVGGELEFEPGSGVLRGLHLQAPEWSAQADGAWTLDSDGRVVFSTTLKARGNKLSEDLRAILPSELNQLFEDIEFGMAGPFHLSDAHLEVFRGGDVPPRTQFTGRLDFVDASLQVGVPITEMSGAVSIEFDSKRTGSQDVVSKKTPGEGAASPWFRLEARADELRVAGVTLHAGAARIESGDRPGHLRVREASGVCHGGRFVVRAEVEPVSPEKDAQKHYQVQFQLAGVRFSTLLRELVDAVKPFVGPPLPEDMLLTPDEQRAFQRARQDEFSRGLLDAELTLHGLVADLGSRRGRGTVRVSGGRVVNLPFITGLIEAGNLQLPFNSSLDYAWASLFVEGPIISFEDLSVQSRAIEISGGGTMTWPDRELDLRLQTRSVRPIPILSDIIQGIRHQFLETRITGKLGEQEIRLQSPGPSRMLDGVLGRGMGESPQQSPGGDRDRDRRRRGIRPTTPSVTGSVQSGLAPAEHEGP